MTNRESITGRKSVLLAANFKLFFSLLFVAGLDLSILLETLLGNHQNSFLFFMGLVLRLGTT